MKISIAASRFAAGLVLSISALLGQGLDSAHLLNPSPDSWPGYNGDYSGMRHSPLTQITPQNVGQMGLSWAFQTGVPGTLKCTPILANGVLYITTPDNVWAVDARSGHQIWHYSYPANKGFHIGHRGVSMYGEWLFYTTPDAHVICLNAKDGTVRWKVPLADSSKGYWSTMSP